MGQARVWFSGHVLMSVREERERERERERDPVAILAQVSTCAVPSGGTPDTGPFLPWGVVPGGGWVDV